MLSELEQFITQQLQKSDRRQTKDHASSLTVGVEHEFFLLNSGGAPADHELSQNFLKLVSEQSDWKIYERSSDPTIGTYASRLSRESKHGYYALKYDHHPHLLEIAFPYTDDLNELADIVSSTMNAFDNIARKIGAKVSENCFLTGSAPESPLKEFTDLRSYRKKLLATETQTPDFYNYAAKIAATQTHIGGTRWWENDSIVSSLYSVEPEMLFIAFSHCKNKLSFSDFIKLRWNGYKTVFKSFPLIGFPNLSAWSKRIWIDSLLASPLLGPSEAEWAGQTLRTLKDPPQLPNADLFKAIRDLQIIRPKLYGTLEFRSDAACPSPNEIISLAAIRLGLVSFYHNHKKSHRPFAESRILWNEITDGAITEIDPNPILTYAHEGLKLRNLKEERFILFNPVEKKYFCTPEVAS